MIGSWHIRRIACAGAIAFAMASYFAATGQGASGTTVVPLTILPEVHLSTASCGDGANLGFGSISRGGTYQTSTCPVQFGSVNATAQLQINDESSTWGMRDSGTAGATILDSPTAGEATLTGFGMCVSSAIGATLSVTPGCAQWYGLNTVPRAVADANPGSDGVVDFRFGVRTYVTTIPGTYRNTVTFTVVAA